MPVVYVLPAICDMVASSLMYVGLTLTYASVAPMIRGSNVVFTGIFSLFFKTSTKKLHRFHWIAIAMIVIGLAIVGISSFLSNSHQNTAPDPILGFFLILAAQVASCVQTF